MRPAPRRSLLLSLAFLLVCPAPTANADPVIRNPGDPIYRVNLHGGPTGRTWRGTERLTFSNLELSALSTIYLRLWSNGVLGCGADAIVVDDVRGGTMGASAKRCTVLPIVLDEAVEPGGTTAIRLKLTIELPIRNDRFGFHRGLALLGTALPTLAIHDDQGWHLPPFVDLGESFYSIVGDYSVTLNVPASLDTPTSGSRVDERFTGGRRITTYVASDVRDFAWAAGHLERVRARTGDTRVNVWFQPKGIRRGRAEEALHAARVSMRTFSRSFGTFPYPEMDVLLTAFTTFGGMEYPTIIFTNPDRLTVSHELAHQWWFGIVGDDEYGEPWLDESFATWSQYLPFGKWRKCDLPEFPSDAARITNDMGYWRVHTDEYWVIYGGGGCLLANLASRFGLDRFVQILRDYAQDHWLGVTRTGDFKSAIESAAIEDSVPNFDPATFWAEWRVD